MVSKNKFFQNPFLSGLIFFIFSLVIPAQEIMVYYNVSFKPDSLQEKYKHDEVVLDISQTGVKFYSSEFLKIDSLQREKGETMFAYPKFVYRLKRALNSNINTEFFDISRDYFMLISEDMQKWDLKNETKAGNGIVLKKAVTSFGNRDWEAWYSDAYPISEGPYKFRGLPGLIFELRDMKDNYIFTLGKIVNKKDGIDTDRFLETNYGKIPIVITLKKYKKLLLDHFDNPLKGQEGLIVADENGNPIKIDARVQTRTYQKHLRKNNNPIDLSVAVKYPDK